MGDTNDDLTLKLNLSDDDFLHGLKRIRSEYGKTKKELDDGIVVSTKVDATGVKDLERFKEQYIALQQLDKKNKVSSYYANEENAIKSLNKAWLAFQKAQSKGQINNDNLTSETKATAVLRMANAYQALGYDMSNVSPEIKEFQEKMSGLMSIKSPDYDYTVEKFAETFRQANIILKDMSDNGFDPSNIIKGLQLVENQTKETVDAIKSIDNVDSGKTANSSVPKKIEELKYWNASLEECVTNLERLNKVAEDTDNKLSKDQIKDYEGYYQRFSELDKSSLSTVQIEDIEGYYDFNKEEQKKSFDKARQELAEYKQEFLQNQAEIEAANQRSLEQSKQSVQEQETEKQVAQEVAEAEKQAALEIEEAERRKREAKAITAKYTEKTHDDIISDLNQKYSGDAKDYSGDADQIALFAGNDDLKGIQKYSQTLDDLNSELSSDVVEILSLNNQLATGLNESGQEIDPTIVEKKLNEIEEHYQETLNKIQIIQDKIKEQTKSPIVATDVKGNSDGALTSENGDNTYNQQTVDDINNEIQAEKESAAVFEESEHKKQEASSETRKEIALTREEMEKQLKSSYKRTGDVDESYLLDTLNIDDELSDIDKYSRALEELKNRQREALDGATMWQNEYSETGDDLTKRWMDQDIQAYHQYATEIEYIQERLQHALKNFVPNANGNNADSINALVLLLKQLNEQIEKIALSFGAVDDNTNFQTMFDSINGINDALSGMKAVFVDIGDGQEFSPLFSAINNIISSIDQLKKAVSNIKLNINLDTSVNEEQALMKVEGRKQDLLRAYQEQFAAMRGYDVGKSKVVSSMFNAKANSGEVSRLNKSILEFDESKYDNIEQRIKAYESMIKRMQEVSKLLYGENVYDNMEGNYQKEVTRAKSNLTRAQNSLGKSSAEEIGNLFGNTDVSALVPKLDDIIDRLDKMVTIALEFSKAFNITISDNNIISQLEQEAESAEKVTEAEREKKSEQTKVIQPDTSVQEQHEREKKSIEEVIEAEQKLDAEQKDDSSKEVDVSGMEKLATATKDAVDAKKEFSDANKDVQNSVDGSKSPLQLEAELMGQIAKSAREAANAKKEFVEANKEVKKNTESSTKGLTDDSEDASSNSKNNKLINNLKKNINKLNSSFNKSLKSNVGIENFHDDLTTVINDYKELIALQDKGQVDPKSFTKISNLFDAFKVDMSKYLDIDTSNKSDVFKSKLNDAKSQLELVRAALDKVQAGEAFTEEDITNIDKYISLVKDLNSNLEKPAKVGNIQRMLGDIAEVLSKNSSMSKELRQEFEKLATEMKSFGDNMPEDKLKEFGYRFETLKTKMKESGQVGLSFFDSIIKKAKTMSQNFIAMYFSLYDIIRYIRTGVTYIRELDKALTEMRKVSDESVQSLKNYQKASFDIAGTIGTTAQQLQNSTADWMRLGESMEEAAESAKVSNILLNVSEFESIDEATESLVAMSAAYDELDKIEIIDKLNNIGNNYSISTDGLATALQRSASALVTAGNDMDEAIALVTAGNAVVQKPDSVGAGLRTIALRITGTEAAKKELEELGEDTSDFVVQTTAKSQQAIKDFTKVASNNFKGFDILDNNGNFKSTYDILLGISEIYEEIVATDKRYGSNMANGLLETLAGEILPGICGNTFYRTHLNARVA